MTPRYEREWHCIVPERVILKVRRISDDKTGAGEGVETQDEVLDTEIVRWSPNQVFDYVDNSSHIGEGNTGPDFLRMIAEIKSGMFDGAMVACYRQDRVFREGVDYATSMKLFDEHNIALLGVRDNVYRTPDGKGSLESQIKSAFAAEELRVIKMRLKDRLTKNRAKGRRHGKVPFGWLPDGTAEPVRAAMVLDATNRVLAGESMRAIAREWNAEDKPRQHFTHRKANGIKLPPEEQEKVVSEWSGNAIQQLILRDCNAGRLTHKGQLLDVAAVWEPIVPTDRFLALTAYLAGRDRPAPAKRHLMGGLIRCLACGGRVCGVINKAGKYTYVFYRCDDCQQAVHLDQVDAFVQAQVIDRLKTLKLPDLATADRRAAMQEMADQLTAIIGQIADTDDRFSNYSRPKDERIDATSHARIMTNLQAGKEHTEREIGRLSKGGSTVLRGLTGANARIAYEGLSMDQRRAVIVMLCRLTLLPGSRRVDVSERILVEWNELG